jgi:hypothetical protein
MPKVFVPTKQKPIPRANEKRPNPESIPSFPELRDELKPFTDLELIYELQMRRKIRRIAAVTEPHIVTWEGEVTSIELDVDTRTGSPFYWVRPLQTIWFMRIEKPFRVKSGVFKDNMPKVGDHVVLQYRIDPRRKEQSSFNNSLIIENMGECKYVWLDPKNGNPNLPIYKHANENEKERKNQLSQDTPNADVAYDETESLD